MITILLPACFHLVRRKTKSSWKFWIRLFVFPQASKWWQCWSHTVLLPILQCGWQGQYATRTRVAFPPPPICIHAHLPKPILSTPVATVIVDRHLTATIHVPPHWSWCTYLFMLCAQMPRLCCLWAMRELNPFVVDSVNLQSTLVLQPAIMSTLYSSINLLICHIFMPFSFPSTKIRRLEKFSNIMQMMSSGFLFSNCPYLPSIIKSANTDRTPCCATCSALAKLGEIFLHCQIGHVALLEQCVSGANVQSGH